MVKPKFLFLLLLVLCAGFVAGEGKVSADFPREIMDDFGYKITINKKPERIVSLAPSNTEILFAIGVGDKVVGVTTYCDYPPQVKRIDTVGGYSTPNIEAIVAKNPDLVIAAYGNGKESIERLKQVGLEVIVTYPESLQGVLEDIELVGKATGYEEKAQRLAQDLQQRMNTVRKKGAIIPEEKRPTVLWIIWYPELWTAGVGTFFDELVRLAGGKNIAYDLEGWKIISEETVLARDPQIIFCSRMGEKRSLIHKIAEDPQLSQTSAVENEWVCELNQDLVERPGPRIFVGLEKISSYIQEWWKQERK